MSEEELRATKCPYGKHYLAVSAWHCTLYNAGTCMLTREKCLAIQQETIQYSDKIEVNQ